MTGLLLALALDLGMIQEAIEVFTPALMKTSRAGVNTSIASCIIPRSRASASINPVISSL